MNLYKNLHYYPLGLFFVFLITFLTTMAVIWDHVAPILPYMSETGAFAPESCIFTQMLNIAVVLMFISTYIRYREVDEYARSFPEQSVPLMLNKIGVILSICTCTGLDVAANFQEPRVSTIHYTGAFICFTAGCLYFCIQTMITSSMIPFMCTKYMLYIRLVLTILAFICWIGCIFTGMLSVQYFKGDNYKKWYPEHGGWEWHVISVVFEWLLSLIFILYILTFLSEFRKIQFHAPVIEFRDSKSYKEGKIDTQVEIKFV